MAVISWNGASNLDLKILGQTFDFRSDVLQISDPSLQANQFDLVENGTDLVIVKSRDATGAPLPAASVTYAYIPNMLLRQVGGTDSSPVSSNIVLSNGGQLYIGDRITDTLTDDAGNDATALSTQLQSVQVWGLGGADTISTGDGADRVYGNTGADSISGGAGNDSIYGGQENDTVSGGGGNDNVAGDAGNDQVNGGSGNDILYGGAGNDVIDPDTGNDTIFAGNGNDTVTVGDSDTGNKLIYMDKLQDYVNIISTTGDHVVYLGENNDIAELEANSGDIQVFGQDGNDEIYAQNSGSDTLDGGNDDDDILVGNGSVGDKVLIGGFGDDNIYVSDTSGFADDQILPNTHVTVSGGEGEDFVGYNRGLFITDANDGGTDDDTIQFLQQTILTLRDKSIENFETVSFSYYSGDRVIFADGNVASGASMDVYGNGGEDYLDAGRETNGTYVLFGGEDSDTLIGGAKNDTLVGGEDTDLLTGGAGKDQFVFEDGDFADTISPYYPEPDVLQDFTGGTDQAIFNGNAFGGVSAIDGYKGTTGVGASANDNLLIATGQGYSTITQFDTFLSEGAADNNKPGFYIFFNTSANRAEMYFDTDMTSTAGAILIATFNNITAVSQLDKLNEGPTGNNSGDFVII
ncbi:hemolysin type calcium-binding protein [Stella humosa]|uniref:Hemolysin type calcium-binding protein n=1 Tax=Stella humosa TaxID=94 RepID=A0A3N1KXD6_9PROT|nr:calcium-binding protein [Stella humosa]ROP83270.1 hemolysin type calcium-binding protein [Stella humosa]